MILVLIIELCVVSIIDIRTNKIPIPAICLMTVLGMLNMIFLRESSLVSIMGFIPGMLFLTIAFFTNQQIGYGDALIIWIMGFYFNIDILCGMLMLAFTCASLLSLGLIVVKRSKRNTEIAFTPFLVLGCGLMRIMQ